MLKGVSRMAVHQTLNFAEKAYPADKPKSGHDLPVCPAVRSDDLVLISMSISSVSVGATSRSDHAHRFQSLGYRPTDYWAAAGYAEEPAY